MYRLKEVILLKEHYHNDVEVYIFYMDIRTPSKGYEEFYRRAREKGVIFIRGKHLKYGRPKDQKLGYPSRGLDAGDPSKLKRRLVVLSTAAIPSKGAEELASILHITRGSDGFFMESHPKLKPMDTPMDGVFLAGAARDQKTYPTALPKEAVRQQEQQQSFLNPNGR